jgi:hypothetical protein
MCICTSEAIYIVFKQIKQADKMTVIYIDFLNTTVSNDLFSNYLIIIRMPMAVKVHMIVPAISIDQERIDIMCSW